MNSFFHLTSSLFHLTSSIFPLPEMGKIAVLYRQSKRAILICPALKGKPFPYEVKKVPHRKYVLRKTAHASEPMNLCCAADQVPVPHCDFLFSPPFHT